MSFSCTECDGKKKWKRVDEMGYLKEVEESDIPAGKEDNLVATVKIYPGLPRESCVRENSSARREETR